MPLVGFMGQRDPGRISTITSLPGTERKKKILPLMGAQLPTTKGDQMYLTLYVRDCSSHEPRGAVVPVELRRRKDNEWTTLGIARCCPLCWTILAPPVGVLLPNPLPQPLLKPQANKLQRMALKLGRAQTKRKSPKSKPTDAIELIRTLIASQEAFTEAEIVESTGKSRTAVRNALRRMLSSREIEIVELGTQGRGKASKYQAP